MDFGQTDTNGYFLILVRTHRLILLYRFYCYESGYHKMENKKGANRAPFLFV
ncbi:hypothetical protein CLW00_1093 [Mongoliibacter ruber]|uniref:Uncharacterized protein n=1 Tax=Mongoliibacter ruber TaxID=1750599 RepID=A0A2T0WHH4_9BACT|nr:hypothetical protein CLW00_1093 [Mongoliibacter ruber]